MSTNFSHEVKLKIEKGLYKIKPYKYGFGPLWKIFSLIYNESDCLVQGLVCCTKCNKLCLYDGRNVKVMNQHECFKKEFPNEGDNESKDDDAPLMDLAESKESLESPEIIERNIQTGHYTLLSMRNSHKVWNIFRKITDHEGNLVIGWVCCSFCNHLVRFFKYCLASMKEHKCFVEWYHQHLEEMIRTGSYTLVDKQYSSSPIWSKFASIAKQNKSLVKNLVCCRQCLTIFPYQDKRSETKLNCHQCFDNESEEASQEDGEPNEMSFPRDEQDLIISEGVHMDVTEEEFVNDNKELKEESNEANDFLMQTASAQRTIVKQKLDSGLYTLKMMQGRPSLVWQVFAAILKEDGILLENFVCCTKCKQVFKICGLRTGNLKIHHCFTEFKLSDFGVTTILASVKRKLMIGDCKLINNETDAKFMHIAKKNGNIFEDFVACCQCKEVVQKINQEEHACPSSSSESPKVLVAKPAVPTITVDDKMKADIKENINAKIYTLKMQTQARSKIWQIFALIMQPNGVKIKNYVFCIKCKNVTRLTEGNVNNLQRHPCYKEYVNKSQEFEVESENEDGADNGNVNDNDGMSVNDNDSFEDIDNFIDNDNHVMVNDIDFVEKKAKVDSYHNDNGIFKNEYNNKDNDDDDVNANNKIEERVHDMSLQNSELKIQPDLNTEMDMEAIHNTLQYSKLKFEPDLNIEMVQHDSHMKTADDDSHIEPLQNSSDTMITPMQPTDDDEELTSEFIMNQINAKIYELKSMPSRRKKFRGVYASIFKPNDLEIKNYVFCKRCQQVLQYHDTHGFVLYRHGCYKDSLLKSNEHSSNNCNTKNCQICIAKSKRDERKEEMQIKDDIRKKLAAKVYSLKLNRKHGTPLWKMFARIFDNNGLLLEDFAFCTQCKKILKSKGNNNSSNLYRHYCYKSYRNFEEEKTLKDVIYLNFDNVTNNSNNCSEEGEEEVSSREFLQNSHISQIAAEEEKEENSNLKLEFDDDSNETQTVTCEDFPSEHIPEIEDSSIDPNASYLKVDDGRIETLQYSQLKIEPDLNIVMDSHDSHLKTAEDDSHIESRHNSLDTMDTQMQATNDDDEEPTSEFIMRQINAKIYKLKSMPRRRNKLRGVYARIFKPNDVEIKKHVVCKLCQRVLQYHDTHGFVLYRHGCYKESLLTSNGSVKSKTNLDIESEEENDEHNSSNCHIKDCQTCSAISRRGQRKEELLIKDGILKKLVAKVYSLRLQRKPRTPLWRMFAKILDSNGWPLKDFAFCTQCKGILKSKGNNSSNLYRHHCYKPFLQKMGAACQKNESEDAEENELEEYRHSKGGKNLKDYIYFNIDNVKNGSVSQIAAEEEGEVLSGNSHISQKEAEKETSSLVRVKPSPKAVDKNSSFYIMSQLRSKVYKLRMPHKPQAPMWQVFAKIVKPNGNEIKGMALCTMCKRLFKCKNRLFHNLQRHICFKLHHQESNKVDNGDAEDEQQQKSAYKDFYFEMDIIDQPSLSHIEFDDDANDTQAETDEDSSQSEDIPPSKYSPIEPDESYLKADDGTAKAFILAKLYSKCYRLRMQRNPRIALWKIFAHITRTNGSAINDFVFCTRCQNLMKFKNNNTANLYRHICFKNNLQQINVVDATQAERESKSSKKDFIYYDFEANPTIEPSYESPSTLIIDDGSSAASIKPIIEPCYESSRTFIMDKLCSKVYKLGVQKNPHKHLWKVFAKIVRPNGTDVKDFICCNLCKKVLRCKNKRTSNLHRHICYRKTLKENSPHVHKQEDEQWDGEGEEEHKTNAKVYEYVNYELDMIPEHVEYCLEMGVYKLKGNEANPQISKYAQIINKHESILKNMLYCNECKTVVEEHELDEHNCEDSHALREEKRQNLKKRFQKEKHECMKAEIKTKINAGNYQVDNEDVMYNLYVMIRNSNNIIIEGYLYCIQCGSVLKHEKRDHRNIKRHRCYLKALKEGEKPAFRAEKRTHRENSPSYEDSRSRDSVSSQTASHPIWSKYELIPMSDGSNLKGVVSCRLCKMVLRYDGCNESDLQLHKCLTMAPMRTTLNALELASDYKEDVVKHSQENPSKRIKIEILDAYSIGIKQDVLDGEQEEEKEEEFPCNTFIEASKIQAHSLSPPPLHYFTANESANVDRSMQVVKEKITKGLYRLQPCNVEDAAQQSMFAMIIQENGQAIIEPWLFCRQCSSIVVSQNLNQHSCYRNVQRKLSHEDKAKTLAVYSKWSIEVGQDVSNLQTLGFSKLLRHWLHMGAKQGGKGLSQAKDYIPNSLSVAEKLKEMARVKQDDIKNKIKDMPSWLNISVELWPEVLINKSFLSLTLHYAKDFKLQQLVLGVKSLQPVSNNDQDIRFKIDNILADFEIFPAGKNIIYVLEETNEFKQALNADNSRLINCSSYMLAKVIDKSLEDTPQLVGLTNNCSLIAHLYKDLIGEQMEEEEEQSQPEALLTDCNSSFTLLLLISSKWFEIRKFKSQIVDTLRLSQTTWMAIQTLMDLFKNVEIIMKRLQDNQSPSLCFVIPSVKRLKMMCESIPNHEATEIALFKANMLKNLDAIWCSNNINMWHKIAYFLYPPTNKEQTHELPDIKKFCMEQMKAILPDQVEKAEELSSPLSIKTPPSDEEEDADEIDFFFPQLRTHNTNARLKTQQQQQEELERYCLENVLLNANFNVLQWWESNANKYPLLSKLALQILTIPASTKKLQRLKALRKNVISQSKDVDNILFLNSLLQSGIYDAT
uniref:BED-type domain-containing protein n=2 Tax=Stomoxys calcitrans TaxID=35570 RepID=A0A1I8Q317_STOCA